GTAYTREICVHLAGPGTGILSAVCALLVFGNKAAYFAGLSVWLAILNLLPVQGFDGGGVLSCLLSLFLTAETVYRVCRAVSGVTLFFLWTAVLWIELRVRAVLTLLLFILYIVILSSNNRKF
ncbi:MAG: site-2 protease family protein, partial [Clostridia bacterium]|nr:site-2 protease family protein [Clostridia bacterium]